MGIPMVDLKAQYAGLREEILEAIDQALQSMQLFLGPNVQALEDEFARYCGARHGIGVGSGTDALILALQAARIQPGDEVITTPWTFIATLEAIHHLGATPVLVDIDPRTYCLDTQQVAAKITPRTKALIPVHIYGHPADMNPLMELAAEYGLFVLEDAAQAHGAKYRGRTVGSLGHAAAFSFYLSKNLGAYGEAGMVTTDDDEIAQRVRMLRNHGDAARHQHEVIGFNSRLDEVQAAILRVKLKHLPEWIRLRQEHAASYNRNLAAVDVLTPFVATDVEHSFYLYTVRTAKRDRLTARLQEADIAFALHYQRPQYRQPACAHWALRPEDFPQCELASREVISLPMYPELTDQQIAHVCETVAEAVA